MKITVLEYERLLIKQHRDEQLHYITSDDAMQLDAATEYFCRGRSCIRPKR